PAARAQRVSPGVSGCRGPGRAHTAARCVRLDASPGATPAAFAAPLSVPPVVAHVRNAAVLASPLPLGLLGGSFAAAGAVWMIVTWWAQPQASLARTIAYLRREAPATAGPVR